MAAGPEQAWKYPLVPLADVARVKREKAPAGKEGSAYLARQGDLCVYGINPGLAFICNQEVCALTRDYFTITPAPGRVLPQYLQVLFASGVLADQLALLATGRKKKVLGLKGAKELLIPLPPRQEQERLVDRWQEAARREEEKTRLQEELDRLCASFFPGRSLRGRGGPSPRPGGPGQGGDNLPPEAGQRGRGARLRQCQHHRPVLQRQAPGLPAFCQEVGPPRGRGGLDLRCRGRFPGPGCRLPRGSRPGQPLRRPPAPGPQPGRPLLPGPLLQLRPLRRKGPGRRPGGRHQVPEPPGRRENAPGPPAASGAGAPEQRLPGAGPPPGPAGADLGGPPDLCRKAGAGIPPALKAGGPGTGPGSLVSPTRKPC